MKQPQWDKYEAAFLLEYCLKVENNELSRKEAITTVSEHLRERAKDRGFEIDEVFRNENGISMQMSAMRNCYLEKNKGLTISKLFKEVVALYKTNRNIFEKIIQEESSKVNKTIYQEFLLWLKTEKPNDAFSVIDVAKDQWEAMTGDLNSRVTASKTAVMKVTEVKSDSIMRHLLPIHPMAALVLKNIATAFQSNQRSMFDFIKTPKDLNIHAFQWFIQNTSPVSERPLLTVDMLWNFFYENGKDYLTSDIKLILDTYPQQTNLTEKEKVVLKTILIMQAVDQRLGGAIPVLKPTDQNLSYAFEGDWDVYENECRNIAKALVKKGVLIHTQIADGKQVYSAAVLAGDGAKIDCLKDDVRKNSTTTKLVEEGNELGSALGLTPPLRLRYATNIDTGALPVVTTTNFVKTMDVLKSKDISWHFYAVLALAKNDEEAQSFRNLIKKTIANAEYKNIIVVDALSTPLGLEAFEDYVNYSAILLAWIPLIYGTLTGC